MTVRQNGAYAGDASNQGSQSVRKAPKYVTTDPGPDGTERFYFRRPGQSKIRIHGVPWTPSFMAEYEAALGGKPVVKTGIPQIRAGTFRWLCEQYYTCAEFRQLDDEKTKPVRKSTLEKICNDPINPGSKILAGDTQATAWTKKAVRSMRDRVAEGEEFSPDVANGKLKAMRQVFKYGVDAEHIEADPARDVKYLPTEGDGYHSWTIEEVEQFEAKHPVGSRERLAMGLLLYTGQRLSDTIKMGPHTVKDGWLKFTQFKGRKKKAIHMEIPLRPELSDLIAGTETGTVTFLLNAHGKPFRPHAYSVWFADACVLASVPGRSHGLRKAAAARLAELGATEKEIMAITGHTTSKEIKRYTEAADKRKLAAKATALSAPKKRVA